MKCNKCGCEVEQGEFCSECGNELEKLTYADHRRKSRKRGRIALVIVFILYALVEIVGSIKGDSSSKSLYDIEYTNNSGEKTPIVVNEIEMMSEYGGVNIIIEVENLKNKDYRDATLVALAWDGDGFPIKIEGIYEISIEEDYCIYFNIENLAKKQKKEVTYTLKEADIEYMSIFLLECTDFEGKTWENPVGKYLDKIQGKKLEETELYYFEFESNVVEDIDTNEDYLNVEEHEETLNFMGQEGIYICTSGQEDWLTGKIEILSVNEEYVDFSLGTLDFEYPLMEGRAQILDECTAEYVQEEFTVFLRWTDSDNILLFKNGVMVGWSDAGTVDELTNSQVYYRDSEFNK